MCRKIDETRKNIESARGQIQLRIMQQSPGISRQTRLFFCGDGREQSNIPIRKDKICVFLVCRRERSHCNDDDAQRAIVISDTALDEEVFSDIARIAA